MSLVKNKQLSHYYRVVTMRKKQVSKGRGRKKTT